MEDFTEELQIQQFVGSDHVTKAATPPSGGAWHSHFEAFDQKYLFKRLNLQK